MQHARNMTPAVCIAPSFLSPEATHRRATHSRGPASTHKHFPDTTTGLSHCRVAAQSTLRMSSRLWRTDRLTHSNKKASRATRGAWNTGRVGRETHCCSWRSILLLHGHLGQGDLLKPTDDPLNKTETHAPTATPINTRREGAAAQSSVSRRPLPAATGTRPTVLAEEACAPTGTVSRGNWCRDEPSPVLAVRQVAPCPAYLLSSSAWREPAASWGADTPQCLDQRRRLRWSRRA